MTLIWYPVGWWNNEKILDKDAEPIMRLDKTIGGKLDFKSYTEKTYCETQVRGRIIHECLTSPNELSAKQWIDALLKYDFKTDYFAHYLRARYKVLLSLWKLLNHINLGGEISGLPENILTNGIPLEITSVQNPQRDTFQTKIIEHIVSYPHRQNACLVVTLNMESLDGYKPLLWIAQIQ